MIRRELNQIDRHVIQSQSDSDEETPPIIYYYVETVNVENFMATLPMFSIPAFLISKEG